MGEEEEIDHEGTQKPLGISQMDSKVMNINKSQYDMPRNNSVLPYPEESLFFNFITICFCLQSATEPPPLLEDPPEKKVGRKTLVLDLDETLVHSSFQETDLASIQIALDLEEGTRMKHFDVYVIKRPGVDEFLKAVSAHYEVVVFTASIERYANPLLKLLDPNGYIDKYLYRESCIEYNGSYVKDLRRLGRDLKNVIIVDNSPAAYQFQIDNAIGCRTFTDDLKDTELTYTKDFLLRDDVLNAKDVREVLNKYNYVPESEI